MTIKISTTYETLESIMGVYGRTKKNGGSREESTAVIGGFISEKGEQGFVGTDGMPHCIFPKLTDEQMLMGVTSIQSHPFTIVGEDGYHTTMPSADDMALFRLCDLNIIVGYINTPTNSSEAYPTSSDKIGAAFFDASSTKIGVMSMRSIEKIVDNRSHASNSHFKKLLDYGH